MHQTIVERLWEDRWADLEAAGWEKSLADDCMWHPRWGCQHIVRAENLQRMHDLKRGRIGALVLLSMLGSIWLLLL